MLLIVKKTLELGPRVDLEESGRVHQFLPLAFWGLKMKTKNVSLCYCRRDKADTVVVHRTSSLYKGVHYFVCCDSGERGKEEYSTRHAFLLV